MSNVVLILTIQLLIGCHGDVNEAMIEILPRGPAWKVSDTENRTKVQWRQQVIDTASLMVTTKLPNVVPRILVLEPETVCPSVQS